MPKKPSSCCTGSWTGKPSPPANRPDDLPAIALSEGKVEANRHAALHLLRARALWQQGRKDEARAAVNEYLYLAGNGPSAQALAEPPFNSMGKRV